MTSPFAIELARSYVKDNAISDLNTLPKLAIDFNTMGGDDLPTVKRFSSRANAEKRILARAHQIVAIHGLNESEAPKVPVFVDVTTCDEYTIIPTIPLTGMFSMVVSRIQNPTARGVTVYRVNGTEMFRTREEGMSKTIYQNEIIDLLKSEKIIHNMVSEETTSTGSGRRQGLVIEVDGVDVKWSTSKNGDFPKGCTMKVTVGEPTENQKAWLLTRGTLEL